MAGKLATVREVKIAALIAFGIAALAGLGLAARVTWWLIPLGLVCGIAGWAYTGGPRPYGYLGFGELFVFVFFGLVATAGSAYVQHAPFVISLAGHLFAYQYDWWFALWAGVPVGLLAAALLQANNLRDIATDTESGKKTLAVRLGRRRAGLLYCFTLMGVALSIGVVSSYRPWSLLALLAFPVAIAPLRLALSDQEGRACCPCWGRRHGCRCSPERFSPSGCSFEAARVDPSGGARLDRVEPVTHDPAGLFGLGQVHGMAPTRDQGRDAVRHESGHPQRVRGEAGVVRSRPWPGRGRGASRGDPTGAPGCRSRTVEGWRPGRLALLRSRSARCAASPDVEPFEERPAQPGVDEVLDVARGLELVGQRRRRTGADAHARPGPQCLRSRR